eukprot:3994169-Amphidinium_carterae.3
MEPVDYKSQKFLPEKMVCHCADLPNRKSVQDNKPARLGARTQRSRGSAAQHVRRLWVAATWFEELISEALINAPDLSLLHGRNKRREHQ